MPGRDNLLGLPSKNSLSYFRSSNIVGITVPVAYGFGPLGGNSFELKGSALSIMTDDTVNGTRIVCNEEGLYNAVLTMRVSTTSTQIMVVRFNPASGTTFGSYSGTLDEVAFANTAATGIRTSCSGNVYMLPGQYLMVLVANANSVAGSSLQITKVSGAI